MVFECGIFAFGAGASDWVGGNGLGQSDPWNHSAEGVEGGGVCAGECEESACGVEFSLSDARDLSRGRKALGGVLSVAVR